MKQKHLSLRRGFQLNPLFVVTYKGNSKISSATLRPPARWQAKRAPITQGIYSPLPFTKKYPSAESVSTAYSQTSINLAHNCKSNTARHI